MSKTININSDVYKRLQGISEDTGVAIKKLSETLINQGCDRLEKEGRLVMTIGSGEITPSAPIQQEALPPPLEDAAQPGRPEARKIRV